MTCYVISFEPIGLQAAGNIRERLKTFDNYCPINAYSWAVMTTWSAAQVRDYLQASSPTSRIFVVRSGTEAAWLNSYGVKNNDWLKKNL
jgi:hypothetical protein